MGERALRVLMLAVRYGVPLGIFIAGIVVALTGEHKAAIEGSAMFFGSAIAVLLLNVLFRMGVEGDGERDVEEEARRYFDRHGRWPDGR